MERRTISRARTAILFLFVFGVLVARLLHSPPWVVYYPDWWLAKTEQILGMDRGKIVSAASLTEVAKQISERNAGAWTTVHRSRVLDAAWVSVWKGSRTNQRSYLVHRSYCLLEIERGHFLVARVIDHKTPVMRCVSGTMDQTDSWASYSPPSHP